MLQDVAQNVTMPMPDNHSDSWTQVSMLQSSGSATSSTQRRVRRMFFTRLFSANAGCTLSRRKRSTGVSPSTRTLGLVMNDVNISINLFARESAHIVENWLQQDAHGHEHHRHAHTTPTA